MKSLFRLSVIPISLAALALLAGCLSAKIPTQNGDITANAFLHKAALPKGTYATTTTYSNGVTSNVTITIEGYTGSGDSDTVGAIVESAVRGAVKGVNVAK